MSQESTLRLTSTALSNQRSGQVVNDHLSFVIGSFFPQLPLFPTPYYIEQL